MATTGTMRIRRATNADLGAVLELYAEAGLAGETPVSADEARDILARISRYPSYRLWIAETDGGIVGTYALLVADNIAHAGRPYAIVEQVAVARQRRNAGIGTLMMRHAMDLAIEAGCYKLMLSSHVTRTDAHAFYEKLGFARHGYSFVVALGEAGRAPRGAG